MAYQNDLKEGMADIQVMAKQGKNYNEIIEMLKCNYESLLSKQFETNTKNKINFYIKIYQS